MACNGARTLGGLGLVAALISVAAACTGSSGSGTDTVDDTRLAVNGVERVFITRPFSAPSPPSSSTLISTPDRHARSRLRRWGTMGVSTGARIPMAPRYAASRTTWAPERTKGAMATGGHGPSSSRPR